jgi:hypothetical protein
MATIADSGYRSALPHLRLLQPSSASAQTKGITMAYLEITLRSIRRTLPQPAYKKYKQPFLADVPGAQ